MIKGIKIHSNATAAGSSYQTKKMGLKMEERVKNPLTSVSKTTQQKQQKQKNKTATATFFPNGNSGWTRKFNIKGVEN